MKDKIEKKSLGQGLIEAMDEALEHSRGQLKARTRTVELPKEVKTFSKSKLVKLRKQVIKGSQPVMAAYMNVSPHTVRSWEQDKKAPKGSTALLMALYEQYPKLMKALRHKMISPEEANNFVDSAVDKDELEKLEEMTTVSV